MTTQQHSFEAAQRAPIDPLESLPPNVIGFPGTPEGAYQEQQTALSSIPVHDVAVDTREQFARRRSIDSGVLYQDKVRYSDGAIRVATLGVPNNPVSDYIVFGSDPLFTGEKGLNEHEIEEWVKLGFNVIWNHHHGEHAKTPSNAAELRDLAHFVSSKGVGKSACQDIAYLDDIAPESGDSDKLIRVGASRGGMTGEAFIALLARGVGEAPNRKVAWSNLRAECFVRSVGAAGFFKTLGGQLPAEAGAIADIAFNVAKGTPINADGERIPRLKLLRSLNGRMINLIHEIGWIPALVGGETGIYKQAVPLDTRGFRILHSKDDMSQHGDQVPLHANRPYLEIIKEPGAHLSLATPSALASNQARNRALRDYIRDNGDLSQVTPQAVNAYL